MREEIRVAAIDSNLGPAAAEQLEAAGETYTRLLQSDAAAFVKELVNVGSAERRCESASLFIPQLVKGSNVT